MVSQLKRHEIQVLLKAGFSLADVAARSGTSIATVRRVRAEAPITHADDACARAARRVGRPSKAAPFVTKVITWVTAEPELSTQELLARARESGYLGSKSAFYALVAALRPPQPVPIVRFQGLPGDFSQHDFSHVDVHYAVGRKQRVHFFASQLRYSRFTQVTLVDDARLETIIRCLARHFVCFGGLPLIAVFDRPKAIMHTGGSRRRPKAFNATFAQAILDIGVGVELCDRLAGNQKGCSERLVDSVKRSFFEPRQFQDEADLRAQLAAWHIDVNIKTPSRATGRIPELRRQEELPRLRPVKVLPEELALRFPIVVGPTAEVVFEDVAYSTPPQAAHVAGTLFLYADRVRIVAGRFEAEHQRRRKNEPPEHRAKVATAANSRSWQPETSASSDEIRRRSDS